MAKALARGLQELGPTFIKLGQLIATRADFIPQPFVDELRVLQDQASPLPFTDILEVLRKAYGQKLEDIFEDIDEKPLASASIAQVHAARMKDGASVVVKVQRPGSRDLMESDFRLLIMAAKLVERRVPSLKRHQPLKVIEELETALLSEFDFTLEAENQTELRERNPQFVIPAVYPELTRKNVLVSSRIIGQPANDKYRDSHPFEAKQLAPIAAQNLLKMMVIDGVFHADPHPGNVFVLPDGRLGLLDFGAVGRLSARRREQVLIVLGSLIDTDASAVCDVLIEWAGQGGAPTPQLEQDVDRFLLRYAVNSRPNLRLVETVTAFLDIARRNGLTLPPDLVLLLRTLGTAEGLARGLDPDIDIIGAIAPIIIKAFSLRFKPRAIASRSLRAFREIDQIADLAPEVARRALARLRRDGFTATIKLTDFDELSSNISSGSKIVALAIVASATLLAITTLQAVMGDYGRTAFLFLLGALFAAIMLLIFRLWRR